MFSYQMKLISFDPVGPASSFNLPLLHTHQLVSIPADGGLCQGHRSAGDRGVIVMQRDVHTHIQHMFPLLNNKIQKYLT